MVKLFWWEKFRCTGRNVDGIRDHKVEAERHKAAIELARLQAEKRYLDEREFHLREEIRSIGRPEAWGKHKRREGRICFVFFIAALLLTVGAVLWALQAVELSWAKQLLIAFSIIVVSVGGFEYFFRQIARLLSQTEFRKKVLRAGLIALLCGVIGSTLLAVSRGLVTSIQTKQSQVSVTETDNDHALTIEGHQLEKIKRISVLLDVAMVLALVCLALGSEIIAGLSFFDMRFYFSDAASVLGLYGELKKVQKAIVQNEHKQEASRRGPEILFEELTAGGLYIEAQEQERALVKTEKEVKEPGNQGRGGNWNKEEEVTDSVNRIIRKTIIAVLAGLVLVGVVVGWALAADTVVIGLDLTTSSQAPNEFENNLRALEGVIRKVNAGDRLVILGIGSESFGAQSLLDETAPLNPGRFGERLEAWRMRLIKVWRARAQTLKPTEVGTDLFGFFNRAALIFRDDPQVPKRLIVFSDMRQVGQGLNFEQAGAFARGRRNVAAQGLIPNLKGARVWMLGVHTNGVSAPHWQGLHDFWAEYLRRAEAQLISYSPSRRFSENGG